jgi:hypothetical protein
VLLDGAIGGYDVYDLMTCHVTVPHCFKHYGVTQALLQRQVLLQ